MKQFLPTKSAEHEETPVRYSSSEIGRLRPREVPAMLQTESAGTFLFPCEIYKMPRNGRNVTACNCFVFAWGR